MHKDVVDAYKKTKMEEEIEKEEEMKKMNPNPDLVGCGEMIGGGVNIIVGRLINWVNIMVLMD